MALANITGYSIGLFVHILAVVVAFGPTFAYGIIFSVLPKYPRATPALIEGIQRVDRYLVNPGAIVVLLAGIYMLADGPWEGSESWITIGFVAIIALLGLIHAFFRPQTAKARELAERDLGSGDDLSDEFEDVAQRIGMVGQIASLIVIVTIFFMTVKP
jgi:Predicted integral membrane protein (DUF2269)